MGYNNKELIKSSVHLQWIRPVYTGGVAVTQYKVTANGRREEVRDESETITYTTTGLVYGKVKVSAINLCGLESLPANLNIPAEGAIAI